MSHNLSDPSHSSQGYEEYSLAGVFHNISGFSIKSSGWYGFYINGVEYTEEEYNRILKVNDVRA